VLIIPAIDLKNGCCVRLFKGLFDQETVYGDDPGAMARRWADAGAEWIHIVDLDGSKGQTPINQQAIMSIRKAVDARLELGGGIRDMQTISYYLDQGLDRIILGTVALRNPELVQEAAEKYPDQIAVGLDAKGDKVVVEAWTEATDMDYVDLARKFENMGVSAFIYTDVDRDGTQTGPNLERTGSLARAVNVPVIASGGIKDMADIKGLMPLEPDGVVGAITGRAIYEGSLDLAEAIRFATGKESG
jgi:phosphoribosylformimino-5-aminoimidazole carboxamide ribotide isomerase